MCLYVLEVIKVLFECVDKFVDSVLVSERMGAASDKNIGDDSRGSISPLSQ